MIEKLHCISLKKETVRRKLMIDQLDKYFDRNTYEIIDATTIDNPIVETMYNNMTLKKTNIYFWQIF